MIVGCVLYSRGHRVDVPSEVASLTKLDEYPDCYAWVGLNIPTRAELTSVMEALNLADHIDVEATLRPHARPIMTVTGPVIEFVLRTAHYVDSTEVITLGEISALVSSKALVTIRFGHASPLGDLRSELERSNEGMPMTPYGALAEVLLKVIGDYSPALDGFENDLTEVEADVFSELPTQPVRRLFRLKREVRLFQAPLEALEDPLARLSRQLLRSCDLGTDRDNVVGDVASTAHQLERTISRTRSLSSLLDSALTASLAQIGVRQNEDMRKMSAWVSMGGAATLIAGIYGMNFVHMPELGWAAGYPFALFLMLGVVGFLYGVFRRRGWI